jgi:hypothetical protein
MKAEEEGMILTQDPSHHPQNENHKSLFSQYGHSKVPATETNQLNQNPNFQTQYGGHIMNQQQSETFMPNITSSLLNSNNMNHLINQQHHINQPSHTGYGYYGAFPQNSQIPNNTIQNTNFNQEYQSIPTQQQPQLNQSYQTYFQNRGSPNKGMQDAYLQNKPIKIPLINNEVGGDPGYHHDPTPQVKLEDHRIDNQLNELQSAFSEIELNSFLNLGGDKTVSPKDFETFINNVTPKNFQNYYGGNYQDPSPKNLELLLNSTNNNGFPNQDRF